jgi:putative ABC transport system permease protein
VWRQWLSDFRYGARSLVRSPGFAAAGLVTLGLGIGANTAIFSLVQAVLLRPLPYPEPERLVQVWQTTPAAPTQGASPANFLDWRRDARSFEALAAFEVLHRNLTGASEPLRVVAAIVSPDFFRVIGVGPALGRTFDGTAPDGAARQAVVSHGLWTTRFSSSADMNSRSVELDGQRFDIVGVMPAGFEFPERPDVWILAEREVPELPIAFDGDVRTLRDARYLGVIGRLGPSVTPAAAQVEMSAIAARLARDFPADNENTGVRVVPLHEQLAGETGFTLVLLLGVVGFVLLIACVNVANLMLARGARRTREMAIRASLGATRAALLRQSLCESVMLSLAGGALGIIVALGTRPLIAAAFPPDTLGFADVRIDRGVLLFTAAASLGAAIVFGLAPAWRASTPSIVDAIKLGAPGAAGPGRDRVRRILVSAEVALALVLLTGAALMAQSVWQLGQSDPGFRSGGVLTATVSLAGMPDDVARRAAPFYERALDAVSTLPGVESAGAIHRLPFGGRSMMANIRVEGRAFRPTEAPDVCWRVVSPRYFETLRIPLLRGRFFNPGDADAAPAVAIVNATLARRLWPDAHPIGRRIATGLDGEQVWTTIVGVVGDTPQEGLGRMVLPEMYRPLAQRTRYGGESLQFVVRAEGDSMALAPALRAAVWSVDPTAPVSEIRTLDEVASASIAGPRNVGALLGGFALLALILAAVGLYGVLSCIVNERTRELGIRIALGAAPPHVIALVLRHSLGLVILGLAGGTLGAMALTRLLEGHLHGVSATDPWTFAACALVLILVGLVAAYLPAARATRVDALRILRAD